LPDTDASASKGFWRKPIASLIVAALSILGGYWLFFYDPPPAVERVVLITAHNRYVTAMGADWDWVLRAEADRVGDYEEFSLLCQDDGKVALRTWHKTGDGDNRYVTAMGADGDWLLRAETDVIDLYEQFTLLDADTGKPRPCSDVVESLESDGKARMAFETYHEKDGKNRLVTAMGTDWDWVLRAETNELGAYERFTVLSLP
jgi:hypothetical protein